MSDTHQLPQLHDAGAVVFDAAEGPIFFNKLASLGVVPQNEEEARMLLQLASGIEQAEAKVAAAQQANRVSPIKQASDDMAALLGQTPVAAKAVQDAKTADAIKIAAQLMQDPTIYRSIFAIKQAEAAQHAQAAH